MDRNEAMQHGLGYAAGREDASGVLTVTPEGQEFRSGFLVFAEAYADGWDDYNSGRHFMMTNARDAYDRWQETGGRSIFREHDHSPRGS
jgi:hypothetical protein